LKYLCLVYAEEEEITALPDGNMQALIAENVDLCEELRRSGHFVSAAPLDSVKTAVTVRVRNGKASTTDGPFAETREQLGGYYLIEARDLDEAVQIEIQRTDAATISCREWFFIRRARLMNKIDARTFRHFAKPHRPIKRRRRIRSR
jgi:hypothetical protein